MPGYDEEPNYDFYGLGRKLSLDEIKQQNEMRRQLEAKISRAEASRYGDPDERMTFDEANKRERDRKYFDGLKAESAARSTQTLGNSAVVETEPTTLDRVVDRILRAARDAQEIGHKLHNHADAVHGPIPCGSQAKPAPDRPQAAMDRIWAAINELDEAQAYMAEGAGRNCTLA